jgi:prepilin-type N-terminal cleavage/methylation domain-containing protein
VEGIGARRPMPAPRSDQRRGFTLIELLVVIGIVAVLTGLSALSLRRTFVKGQLNENTRALLSMLQSARLRAVTVGVPHGVFVGGNTSSTNAGQIILFRKPPGGSTSPALYDPAADQRLDSRSVQTTAADAIGIQFSSGVPANGDLTVVFDTFGLPNVGTAAPYSIVPASITVNNFGVTNPYVVGLQSASFTDLVTQLIVRSDGGVRVQNP